MAPPIDKPDEGAARPATGWDTGASPVETPPAGGGAIDTAASGHPAEILSEVAVGEAIDVVAALQQLQDEATAARERELRACAELENFRKRTQRQADEERKYAALPVVRDLLAVVDNLERALLAAEQDPQARGLRDGVQLVVQQFQRVLEQHHCRRIEALGQPFDPSVHQAIGQQPSDQYPAGSVMAVTQVGYQLHDRLVRPSLVMVSAGPAGGGGAAGTN